MKIGPEEETWRGIDPIERELERQRNVVYWLRIKGNILAGLVAWLCWEVYDIWPDQDFDPEHVETFMHMVNDNAQVVPAILGFLGVVFASVMQTMWQRKK